MHLVLLPRLVLLRVGRFFPHHCISLVLRTSVIVHRTDSSFTFSALSSRHYPLDPNSLRRVRNPPLPRFRLPCTDTFRTWRPWHSPLAQHSLRRVRNPPLPRFRLPCTDTFRTWRPWHSPLAQHSLRHVRNPQRLHVLLSTVSFLISSLTSCSPLPPKSFFPRPRRPGGTSSGCHQKLHSHQFLLALHCHRKLALFRVQVFDGFRQLPVLVFLQDLEETSCLRYFYASLRFKHCKLLASSLTTRILRKGQDADRIILWAEHEMTQFGSLQPAFFQRGRDPVYSTTMKDLRRLWSSSAAGGTLLLLHSRTA